MTKHFMAQREPITPKEIPAEVRLESGMILARLERATEKHPERHKVIVLVRPRTVQRPVSLFAPDPWSNVHDVTEWHYVRLRATAIGEDDGIPPALGPGSLGKSREGVLRRMHRFVGYIGDVRGPIDWEALR